MEFDVHGSVHLGNVYVQSKVQLDVHEVISILYSSLFLALHVSCAICTHPQEHKLQSTTTGVCNGFGVLIHSSRYWLQHPHTLSTVRFRLSLNLTVLKSVRVFQPVQAEVHTRQNADGP
jgi:hypothetical protein